MEVARWSKVVRQRRPFRYTPPLLFVLLFFLSGHATAQLQIPIDDPNQRFDYLGFSVLPPQGEDWFLITEPGPYKGVFVKRPPAYRHVITAVGGLGKVDSQSFDNPDDWLQLVKKKRRADTPRPRFELVTDSYTLVPAVGNYCVRVDEVVEDHDHPSGEDLIMNHHALYCIHPHAPRLLVSLICMQRAPLGTDLINLAEECQSFLSSVKFKEKKKKE